jgi:hypothetical protein
MAGVVTSSIFLGNGSKSNPRRATIVAAGFGLLMLVAGKALTPYGISKIRATPTWSLYSIGAAVLAFTLLYWICDALGFLCSSRRREYTYYVSPARLMVFSVRFAGIYIS